MSSLMEPSSLVLLIGAICIFIFIIHGLWFSHKPQNRQLKKNNQQDQEISQSTHIGKVRIVTADQPNNSQIPDDALDIERIGTINKRNRSPYQNNTQNNIDENNYQDMQQVSVSINHHNKSGYDIANNIEISDGSFTPQSQMQNFNQGPTQEQESFASQYTNMADISNNSQNMLLDRANLDPQRPWLDVYEIILVSDPDKPYLGEDIERISSDFGFTQGYISPDLKIFFVKELDQQSGYNEVFRICSMEKPYYFPKDMTGFRTRSLALYMSLPPQGKGYAYFKAIKVAIGIFLNRLGGHMYDKDGNQISTLYLEDLSEGLRKYDELANLPQNNRY